MLFGRIVGVLVLGISLTMISISCDRDDDEFPCDEVINNGPTVYVTGIVESDSGLCLAYWKNGVLEKILGRVSRTVPSSIYVSDGDVYVAGSCNEKWYATNGNFRIIHIPVYWKNGDKVKLEDRWDGEATSIVVKGLDVYVAGTQSAHLTSPYIAKYWKNGVALDLSDQSRDGFARSIHVTEDGDVYVGGSQHQLLENPQAVYWKNGVPNVLTSTDTTSFVNDLTVRNSTVYAAGFAKTDSVYSPLLAMYWRDGHIRTLSSQDFGSEYHKKYDEATGIFISESGDVYISGFESYGHLKGARYWKNGNETILTNEDEVHGYATDIFVLGTDVYTCGYNDGAFMYWKNDIGTVLNNSCNLSISEIYEVSSIFVVP